MWPLVCAQCYSMIWSSDLLFGPQMTQFPTCPRFCQGHCFEQVWSIIRLKMCLLSIHKVFYMIWSSNLLFDHTWPNFKPVWVFDKDIILSKFEDDWDKMWPLECSQGSSMYWPSVLLLDSTWPRFEFDLDFVKDITVSKCEVNWAQNLASKSVHKVFLWFDLVTYFLTPHDPGSNWIEILWRTILWASLKLIGLKIWPLECSQGSSVICDSLFDPTWPSFQLDWDLVKYITVSKFEVD